MAPQAELTSQASPSPSCRAAPTPRGRSWGRWRNGLGGPSARPGAHRGPCHPTSDSAPMCSASPCSVHWGVRPRPLSPSPVFTVPRSVPEPPFQAHVAAPCKSSSNSLLQPQRPSLRTQGREPGCPGFSETDTHACLCTVWLAKLSSKKLPW